MQLNPATLRRSGSPQARAEIYAFIAARDLAVSEAERHVTAATLNRAFLANELVQNCLQPARSPYEGQHLVESEADRERKRCEAVTRRLSHLRACTVAAA